MRVAPDGSPVELYARLPERTGDAELVHRLPSDTESDGVRYVLTALDRDGDVLTATIRHEFDGRAAEQRFSVRDTDDARLAALASAAGLRLDSVRNPSATLVLLRPRC